MQDMTVLLWFSICVCVSGVSGQGKSLEKRMGAENLEKDGLDFKDANSLEMPKVTDVQVVGEFDAGRERTWLPRLPNLARCSMPPTTEALPSLSSAKSSCRRRHLRCFLGGSGLCLGRCPGCFQSLGWMLDGTIECCEVLTEALLMLICAMLIAAMELVACTGTSSAKVQ